jgi:hypothetical protein
MVCRIVLESMWLRDCKGPGTIHRNFARQRRIGIISAIRTFNTEVFRIESSDAQVTY